MPGCGRSSARKPAGWWIRRRVHEQTVHRADAALALGVGFQLDPELAADGVSETVERATVMSDPAAPPVKPGTSRCTCTRPMTVWGRSR